MNDTEKLNALIEYIQSAEKYAFEKTICWGNAKVERVSAIQDITSFIENSLGIELEQLPIDNEKAKQFPDEIGEAKERIKTLAMEIGDMPSMYFEGLNDAICMIYDMDLQFVINSRKRCHRNNKSINK